MIYYTQHEWYGTKPWYPGFDSSLNDSDPSQIAQIRILVPLMLMKSRFLIVKRPSKSGEGPAYLDVHVLIRFTDHSTNGIRFNIF